MFGSLPEGRPLPNPYALLRGHAWRRDHLRAAALRVVRAFIKMRSLLTDTRELAKKLAALEKELTSRLDSHETAISEFMKGMMLLLNPPPAQDVQDKEMGFHTGLPPARR